MRSINSNDIYVGIDTHKATHVAVAIDGHGTKLATLSIPANAKGYQELERWSGALELSLHLGLKAQDPTEPGYPDRLWIMV